jgi:hypothetical protein
MVKNKLDLKKKKVQKNKSQSIDLSLKINDMKLVKEDEEVVSRSNS